MNILFIDPVCWREHITYNRYWIEVFRRNQIGFKAVLKQNYGAGLGLSTEDVLWEYPEKIREESGAKIRLLYHIFRQVDVRQFDYVVFSVLDKRAFLLSPFFLFTRSVVVSHVWNNFSFAYNLFLRVLARRHHLISIDPYVHKNLLQQEIPNTLIVHPCPDWKADWKICEKPGVFQAYVPGRNSNREFVDMIRKDPCFPDWLQEQSIRLSVRSGMAYSEKGTLFFTNVFLTGPEYRQNIEKAGVVVIPYDSHFTNRISNVFFEAIALRKNVLIKRHTHLDYYQEFDPQGVHIRFFSTLEELKLQLLYFQTAPPVPEYFYDPLIRLFSIENMCSQFCQLIRDSE